MATTIKLWLAWCYSVVITSSFAQDSTFDNQTIQVPVGEAVNITSSGFPTYCCDSQTFLITAQQPHIRLTFTDIDLSGGSKLIIYDGGNSSSMPFAEQSVFRDGVWSRPVIVSKGTNLFITLEPGKRKEKQNIGFRAVARIATDLSWTVDRPYTNCPPAHDAMQSGKVRLSRLPTTRLDSEFHMMFDCVWQIMTPKNMPDLKVFVRINSINLIDGHIEVRDGPSSVSMLAGSASTSTAPTASQQMEALDESNAFTTSTTSTSSQRAGLYISVVKPVTEGTLFFEYGVYQHTDVPGPKCTLKMDKTSYNGFRCRSTAWCIPAEHKCDGIRNCEDYSDEDEKYCPTTDTEDTSPRPTIIGVTLTTSCRDTTCLDGTCSSPQQDCPEDCRISQTWCHNIRQCRTAYQYGGNSLDVCGEQQDDCPRHHKRCEDGSCVWLWNDCPVTSNCFLHERECRSGTCVNRLYDDCPEDCSSRQKYCSTPKECVASSARCPGEACPSYKPNQCGTSNHCYYDSERCDGMSNCPHYEDEHDCDTSHDDGDSSGMSFLYILFIGAAVILPIILIKCLMKKKTPEQSNTEMQNLNATTTTSSSTRPTATAPAQSTTSRVTRPTTTNSTSAPSQPLLSGSNATASGGAASGEGGADAPPSYDEAVAGNAYAVPDTPTDDALPSYESLSKTQPTVFVEASMDDDDGGGGEGASTAANNTVDV